MSTDAETRAAGRSPGAASDVAPTKLGKYVIERELGSGGMGTVYLARDTELRRTVAIKVLPQDKAGNPTLVRRFKAEAQAAAQLRHDNIVAVYDSGEADGRLYIAMEFVDGRDLHDMVSRRGTIPVKRSIEIVKQVAAALQHAHEHKIVHRDIKPSNLLIRRDGVIKLTDLGLARSVDDTIETGITRAGTTVGTVDYMAPEQARSSKAADIRSDIYSLGCTWYHMLTGSPPYPEGSLTNKLQAHAVKPLPDPRTLNPNVTEGLVAVIHRMMAKKPEDRYQTPVELLQDLESSALTRAAFSQEILNAIDDESGHAVAAPGPSDTGDRPRGRKGKRGTDKADIEDEVAEAPTAGSAEPTTTSKPKRGTLPPPTRRRPVESEDERPPSLLAERLKIVAVAAGVLAAIGGLGWLVSSISNVFDSPTDMIVQPAVDPSIPEGDQPPGSPEIAAVSGGVTGPMSSTATPVAPVFGSPAPGTTPGTLTPRSTASAIAGHPTTPAGVTPGGVSPAATSPPALSPSRVATIRPANPQQRPDWSKQSPRPPAAASFSVGAGPASPTHFASLNDALLKLPPEGGVIKLVGNGPFVLSSTALVKSGNIALLGDGNALSLVVVTPAVDGALGRLQVDGNLEVSNVHLVLDRAAHEVKTDTTLLEVQNGSLKLQASSVTVLGTGGARVTALAVRGSRVPQQLEIRHSVIRGQLDTGVHLNTSAVDVVVDQSLIAVAQGSAFQFDGRSGDTSPDETSRWLRSFSSTLCSRECLIDFSAERALSEQPKTEIVMRDTVGCTASKQGAGVLLNVADWLQSRVRDQITWTSIDSTFMGFQHLLDLGAASSFRVDDPDGWRLFWRQKVDPQEFVSSVWPGEVADIGLAVPAAFDRDLLPVAVRQIGARGEFPGIAADWLRIPDTMHPERLAAMAGRAPLPAPQKWVEGASGPMRVDIRKQDLGQVLSQNDWPDGTVVEAVGYGVCYTTPLSVSGKKLKIIFRQADGGPLRIMPRESIRPSHAAITIRDGVLELEGCRWQFPDVRPRHPAWLVHAVNSAVILRNCDLRGPDEADDPYQGLVRVEAAADAPRGSSYLVIADSLLIGPKALVRCEAGAGKLFVRNSLLAAHGTAVDVRLLANKLDIPFTLDIVSSTLTATQEVFRVQPASLSGPATTPARWYVDRTVFGPPGPWKPAAGSTPALLRTSAPALDQRQLAWWGRNNGIAKDIRVLLAEEGATPPRSIDSADAWESAWGAGHDIRLLTGADGVVLQKSYPSRPDQVALEHFVLHPASKSAVWGDGRPIGIEISRLESAGPAAVEPEPSTKKATPKVPAAPSTRPGF